MDSLIYPLINKCKLNFTWVWISCQRFHCVGRSWETASTLCAVCCFCSPLKRMTVGMFLAALAFVAAGLVQIQIDVRTHIKNKKKKKTVYLHTRMTSWDRVYTHSLICFLEKHAQFPIKHWEPSEVHQHGGWRLAHRRWTEQLHLEALHGTTFSPYWNIVHIMSCTYIYMCVFYSPTGHWGLSDL